MKVVKLFSSLILFLNCFSFSIFSQIPIGIPTGTWRTHFDYSNVNLISFFDNKLYGSASKGFFYLDLEDNSINKMTKIDGLGSVGVSSLYSDYLNDCLIIGYRTGHLDIICKNEKINTLNLFENILDSEIDKKINSIITNENLIYVSTNLGLVVIDMILLEIKEIYHEIGPDGLSIKPLGTNIIRDSLFVFSKIGILKSKIKPDVNLKDYNNWELIEFPDTSIVGSVTLGDDLFIYNKNNIFKYNGSGFETFTFFPDNDIKVIRVFNNELIVVKSHSIYSVGLNKTKKLQHENLNFFFNDVLLLNNNYWVALQNEGIINLENNSFFKVNFSLNTDLSTLFLSENFIVGLKYLKGTNKSDFGYFSLFDGKIWTNNKLDSFNNLTSVATNNANDIFFSSFGYGIYDQTNNLVFNEKSTGATLEKVDENTNSLFITDIIFDENNNLYIANYGVKSALHLLDTKGIWTKFTFNDLKFRYPLDIHLSKDEIIWSRLDIDFGGGILVFDPNLNKSIWLNKQLNGLPDNTVSSLIIDNEDKVWIGTSKGIVFFNNSTFPVNNEKALPLTIDGINFLDGEQINCIAIDLGNRKWIGSNYGIWLIDKNNYSLIFHFNVDNSPLPSNKIIDIAINHKSGEVFFLSDNGLVSYMSDAVESKTDFSQLKIFPNPISLKNKNLVSFYNLVESSTVKITSLSGKLVHSFQSKGGGASWNLLDSKGNVISPGVYLIFLSDSLGNQTFIGKILITK